MELGIYSLANIAPDTGMTVSRRLDEIVGYGLLADACGLDAFGLGEHHTLDFAVSSPAVVLAAIGQGTRHIKLTTAATVLSVLDPVRVYQDFATLDLLTHGRAEMIVGRSAYEAPFVLFGEDPEKSIELFTEKLDLLLQLRRQDHVTWSGEYRPPLDNAPIAPRSFVDEIPVWVGVGKTLASAERAGRQGLPMVLGLVKGTIDDIRPVVEAYRRAGEEAGHPAEKLQLGVTSHFYVSDTAESARDEVFPYYKNYWTPTTLGGTGVPVDRDTMERVAGRGGSLMMGSPEQVTQKLLDLSAELGVNRFFGQVDFGSMPRELVESSIRLFGEQVAPEVRRELGVSPVADRARVGAHASTSQN